LGFFTGAITLFTIILLALFVNRIATVALTFTGMSREMARFQARSAFSTCGFTTAESESVVTHPVRRRIIGTLMLLGNAGFVGVIATTLGAFSGKSTIPLPTRLGILVAGLSLLWALAMSKWVDDKLFRLIRWALKHFTDLDVHDYVNLLQLGSVYSVTEIRIGAEDWLVGQRLDELRLGDIGVNVLGIHRTDGDFVGTPTGGTYIRRGDKLIVYGSRENIAALDAGKGDPEAGARHRQLVEERRMQWKREADRRGEGYCVTEMVIRQKGWLANKRLDELRLGDVGVIVLGIQRVNGEYIGSPVGSTRIRGEDKVIVYGSRENVEALDKTRAEPDGEEIHRKLAAERREERLNVLEDLERAAESAVDAPEPEKEAAPDAAT
jgi:Trk K+ transport system NAD-binding subunit